MKFVLFVLVSFLLVSLNQSAPVDSSDLSRPNSDRSDQPWDDTWEFPALPKCKNCKDKHQNYQVPVPDDDYDNDDNENDYQNRQLDDDDNDNDNDNDNENENDESRQFGEAYGEGNGYYGSNDGEGYGYYGSNDGEGYGYYGSNNGEGYNGEGALGEGLPAFRRNPCRNGVSSLRCRLSRSLYGPGLGLLSPLGFLNYGLPFYG